MADEEKQPAIERDNAEIKEEPAAVVTSQPTENNTETVPALEPQAVCSVVIQDEANSYQPVINNPPGAYSFKLFGFCHNVKFCLLTALCPTIAAAVVSRKMKENVCYGPCCGVLPLNIRYRQMAGIQENLWSEGVKATFCWPCFTCRLYNELDKHGFQ